MRRSFPLVAGLITAVLLLVAAVVLVVQRTSGTEEQAAATAVTSAASAPDVAPSSAPATAPATTTPATAPPPSATPDATEDPAAPHVQAVVSSNTLATDAGAQMLAAGGTAADAALAVAAVLSVVEPFYSSALGGDTWGLYYEAETAAVTSVNGVGPTGSRTTLADYSSRVDTPGMHQAILPGAWDGWMLWLEEYGTLDLGVILQPAIDVARTGYPVSTEMTYWFGIHEADIRADPVLSGIYLRNGALAATGTTIVQTDMAATFEALAEAYDGALAGGRAAAVQAARDYFYRGPIAEAIVAYSDATGGYLTREDFSRYSAEIVEPLSIDYTEDVTVFQSPPNSQGIAMLEALNILKGDSFEGLSPDDPAVVHTQVEATKLAYADRYALVGDPERTPVPTDQLLSDDYAAAQRARIDPQAAATWPIGSGLERTASDTTTFQVVDAAGNAAAVTTSIGGHFLVVGATGIHINERMKFMSLEEGNVNVVAPGATVRHTSNPYMALRGGRPYLLGGNTGVDTQPQGQLQQLMGVIDFGLTPAEAIARPRFISTAFPASTYPYAANNVLDVESFTSQATIDGLQALGHRIAVGQGVFGTASMVRIAADGLTAEAAAEPRNDTAGAVVIPPGQ